MRPLFFLFVLWAVALPSISSATPTESLAPGKITGRITDAASGEAFPAATVRLEDTTMGASADMDGIYTILNVRPGTYTVVASMVGYKTVRVEGVLVESDRTTTLDFELEEEIYEGEEVIVQARRDLIETDRTTSASYVNAEQIESLPVQEVTDLLQLQAGVAYDAGGRLHLRGGRAGEVAYLVDGIPVSDQFRGGSKVEIENSWIQELQVISGTFNAEYGQAQSGVINVVTRAGNLSSYSGSASGFLGSYATGRDDLYMGVGQPSVDQVNAELNLNGPLRFLPSSSFLVSGRYYSTDGWLYGQRRIRVEDTVPIQRYIQAAQQNASDSENLVGIAIPDSLMTGDGAFVPMNPSTKLSLHGNLSLQPFNGFQLGYSVFVTDEERRSYQDSRRYAPDGQPTIYESGVNHILSGTHVLSPTTFYRVGASYQTNVRSSYLSDDPLYALFQGSPYSANGFAFGGTSNGYSRSSQATMLGKVDFTSQVNRTNLIQTGVEAQLHRVSLDERQTVSDGPVYEDPDLRVPDVNTALNNSYTQRPFSFAAYLQDKLEIDEIILNAGIRFDYWNPNADVPADLEATTDPDDGIRLDTETVAAETSAQLSPRLGLAFPISDSGVLHVSYGHFFQVPRFSYIFDNSEFEVELGDLETIMGNANLKPERTVAYEIGLQQGVTADWKVELTVYYKDIRNLLGQEIITTRDTKVYARYVNRDYGNTKGVTLSLIRQFQDRFGFTVDYTYQVARGNASDPNSVFFNNQTQPPVEPEKQVLPLDWDQRHSLNGTVILGDPRDWTLSLIGRFHTGQPYTPSNPGSQLSRQFQNSEREPVTFTLDLNFAKTFQIAGRGVRFFARGYNLLDRLNAQSVYSSTGNPFHPYRTLGETEVLIQNPNFSVDEIDRRPDFFQAPRRVVAGMTLDF